MTSTPPTTGNGDGLTIKVDPDPSTTAIESIGSGTTDADGRFVLKCGRYRGQPQRPEQAATFNISILEERNERGRTGYRHDDSIYLVLQSKDVESILLNDENHRWTTGTYAAAKETISTGPNITMPATKDKPKQEDGKS